MSALSKEQQQVFDITQDTLLKAGAGAGKTTTLIAALAKDLETIAPSKIAVVTFTRAAARSLRARLEEELFKLGRSSEGLERLWLGTIDSLTLRLLRQSALSRGENPGIKAGSEAEMKNISKEALPEEIGSDLEGWINPERDLLGALVNLHEQCMVTGVEPKTHLPPSPQKEKTLLALEELLAADITEKQREYLLKDFILIENGEVPGKTSWNIRRDFPAFSRALAAKNEYRLALIDQRSFKAKEALLEIFFSWRERRAEISREQEVFSFAEVLEMARNLDTPPFLEKMYLDEAQDTSPAQFNFLKSLTKGPMVLVGDPNQSIYGFRQADLDNFLLQTKDIPEIELRDNYRSAPEIIETVEEMCRPLLGDSLINQRAKRKESGSVSSYIVEGGAREEAQVLAGLLEKELEVFKPEEISVLFRSNSDLDLFYDILKSEGLPVAALRSGGLLLQEECQDLLAYLRLLLEPDNEALLFRVLTSPFCNLGPDDVLNFAGEISSALEKLEPTFSRARSFLGEAPLSEIGRFIIEGSGFDLALDALDKTAARRANCAKLLSLLRDEEKKGDGLLYSALLERFYQSLEEAKPSIEGLEAIALQTVHNAKGEEYSLVILPRLGRNLPSRSRRKFFLREDGELGLALPGGLRDSCADPLEDEIVDKDRKEEARLLYVSLTRAKEKLILLASSRKEGKLPGIVSALPNLKDIPEIDQQKKEEERSLEEVELSSSLPELPPIIIRDITWSELSVWKTCSLRKYLEGDLALTGTDLEGGSGARQRGLRVHEAIEKLALGRPREKLKDEEEAMVLFAEKFLEEGQRVEVPFLFALESFSIRGRMDWVSGGIVRDWKTGKRSDYSLQRRIYALAMLLKGETSVRAETIYLETEEVESEQWGQEDLSLLKKEVLASIWEIINREAEPAASTLQPFCAGCPGQSIICPVSEAEQED